MKDNNNSLLCIISALLVIIVTSSGCLTQPSTIENHEIVITSDDSGATKEDVKSVVSSNNQFTFDLYFKFKDEEENIFFSPYSISTALAMTYEGARGQTAEEMLSVLHFPEDDNIRRSSFTEIHNKINKKDKKYELCTANALWAQKDYKFLDEYFNIIEQYYGGKVTNLDFVKDTENSRKTINQWVEEQTSNKIKDLIPSGFLDIYTYLVLTNAIYFKGMWIIQFDKGNTKEEDFRVSPEKIVKAPMMSLTGQEFYYAETEELQILELLYEGEELSMLIFLPKENNMKYVEDSLSLEKLSELRNSLQKQEVDVYIPKFTFETKYFIAETLKEMGMPTAFSENADFSGMDGTKELFISDVIHQAFVEVNEEGTEAAGATAVIMKKTAIKENIIFRADHPFIFMIQDRETGNILFFGRVVNPIL